MRDARLICESHEALPEGASLTLSYRHGAWEPQWGADAYPSLTRHDDQAGQLASMVVRVVLPKNGVMRRVAQVETRFEAQGLVRTTVSSRWTLMRYRNDERDGSLSGYAEGMPVRGFAHLFDDEAAIALEAAAAWSRRLEPLARHDDPCLPRTMDLRELPEADAQAGTVSLRRCMERRRDAVRVRAEGVAGDGAAQPLDEQELNRRTVHAERLRRGGVGR